MLYVQVVPNSVKRLVSSIKYNKTSITQLQSFSYISAKFETAVGFYKETGAQQRRQVVEKVLQSSTGQFSSGCI